MIILRLKAFFKALNPCFIYTAHAIACQEQAGLPPVPIVVFLVLFWQTSLIHDAQFSIYLALVPDGHRPFFRSFKRRQIQRL